MNNNKTNESRMNTYTRKEGLKERGGELEESGMNQLLHGMKMNQLKES